MECPNCNLMFKDDELYCTVCMGKFNSQSGREEDGRVISKIFSSIFNQYNAENPTDKHELERLIKKLEGNEKHLDLERVRIHNTITNVRGMIRTIRDKFDPNSWE